MSVIFAISQPKLMLQTSTIINCEHYTFENHYKFELEQDSGRVAPCSIKWGNTKTGRVNRTMLRKQKSSNKVSHYKTSELYYGSFRFI